MTGVGQRVPERNPTNAGLPVGCYTKELQETRVGLCHIIGSLRVLFKFISTEPKKQT